MFLEDTHERTVLVVECVDGGAILALLCGDNYSCSVYFGHPGLPNAGYIDYNHRWGEFNFGLSSGTETYRMGILGEFNIIGARDAQVRSQDGGIALQAKHGFPIELRLGGEDKLTFTPGSFAFQAPATISTAKGDIALDPAGKIDISSNLVTGWTSQTTVGTSGDAALLPSSPSGYLVVDIEGVEYVVPYYAKE